MKVISKIKNFIYNQFAPKPIPLYEALKGNNVECICCGKTFICFLPFGFVKRSNAQCPFCNSLERHRLHWYYMVHETNLFTNASTQKMLHVAPETIFYNKFRASTAIEYVPCAKFGNGYEDEYPAGTINADITELQFNDNSFDVIYCSHVLEHIPDDLKAMRELQRVLKPGGWALLQVPQDITLEKTYEDFSIIDPAARLIAFGQHDHVRVYGSDYINRLISAGFDVNAKDYVARFTENEIFKYGFMKDEMLFYCTKPLDININE